MQLISSSNQIFMKKLLSTVYIQLLQLWDQSCSLNPTQIRHRLFFLRWGPDRTIPVSLENVKIFEQAFDIYLNPIRVNIELILRVLDLSEFRNGSRGYKLCQIHSDRRNFFIKECGNRNTLNASFTAKIVPRHSWNDLVLSVDKKEQIREICNYAKASPEKVMKLGASTNIFEGRV